MGLKSFWNKLYDTLSSVKTGIFLIIVVGIFSAIGTVILQRPTSEPEDLQRAYSPETLLWLDRLGLTDIFHSWWFLVLLVLFCVCLIFVSLSRWPNAWKMYSKPVRFATVPFRASLPFTAKFPVGDETIALNAAEKAFRKVGYATEKVSEGSESGLFGERQKFAVFAVYVVHISLLLIFAGYILDGFVGYRGNIQVPEGQAKNVIELRDNKGGSTKKLLPFSIRCDAAGMEAYADGSPKKWWSKLALLENGREVVTKTIIVNDPLTYKGIRIYQASMGQSSTPKTLTFAAAPAAGGEPVMVEVPINGKAALPDGESLSVLRFVPDYYIQDNEVFQKSDDPENPAIQLGLTDAKGETKKLWILYAQANTTQGQAAPYIFSIKSATWAQYTGLEVSHQPGQFGVWAGVVVMAFGLVLAFYAQHSRVWATVITSEGGKQLWVGGTTNKNRDRFQTRFEEIKAELEKELGIPASTAKA
jgi:cytochrome c biogenesis protein